MISIGTRIALLLVAGGCAAPPTERTPLIFERVDSAGVQLVRNPDATVDTLAFELMEQLRIGVVDGPEELQFFGISGVELDEEGRVFVVDQGTQSVRLFDHEGRFIRRFAGPGDGPEEFRKAGGLFRWHDTIHVRDAGDLRGALFDTTGSLLATYQSWLPDRSMVVLLGPGPAGWYALHDDGFVERPTYRIGFETPSVETTNRFDPGTLALVTSSRAAAESLLVPVVRHARRRIFGVPTTEGGGERWVGGQPPLFERSPSRAIDGRGTVHVSPGWPYLVDSYDPSGRLTRRLTRAHDSVVVTDRLVEDVLRRARAYFDTTRQRTGATYYFLSQRATLPRIGYVPVVTELRASPEGWLWVRRGDVTADPASVEWTIGESPQPTHWDLFDVDGRYKGTVRLPPNFSPHRVLRDAVVGVKRDSLNVEYVVRYRLRPNLYAPSAERSR